MKRIAAIVVITALILTMSVGTAYAAICAGMVCSPAAVAPMDMAGCSEAPPVQAVVHGMCGHEITPDLEEAVAVQPAMGAALPAEGLPVPAPLIPSSAERRTVASDARGAPHLTSVIRI